MTDENKEMTPSLVMRRFFVALKTENLMAAELLATHENFDGGDVDYSKTLTKLVTEGLSTATLEWLLTYAKGSKTRFFRPSGEYAGRRRHSGNNWRGWICDMVRRWMTTPMNLTDEQRRIARLVYDIGWLTPDLGLMDSPAGRDWLLKISTPDKLLKMALTVRTSWERGKHVTQPICSVLVDMLIAKGPPDLSLCGSELLAQYKDDVGRAVALRLIRARDTSIPMPREFTAFITEVVEQYKWYQRVTQDLPTLIGAKTNEIDP